MDNLRFIEYIWFLFIFLADLSQQQTKPRSSSSTGKHSFDIFILITLNGHLFVSIITFLSIFRFRELDKGGEGYLDVNHLEEIMKQPQQQEAISQQ